LDHTSIEGSGGRKDRIKFGDVGAIRKEADDPVVKLVRYTNWSYSWQKRGVADSVEGLTKVKGNQMDVRMRL